jgi:myo-inositol-1-phosphate synthase
MPLPLPQRLGVWLVGARGSVATTTVAGAAAMAAGLTGTTGCVTADPEFADAALPAFDDLVFGGHDVSAVPLPKHAEQLADSGVLPGWFLEQVRSALSVADREIRPGATVDHGKRTQQEVAEGLVADLRSFRSRTGVTAVVVVNVASTEAPAPLHPATASLEALRAALATELAVLPLSSLYAYAALSAGCAYVDFTPSTGARLPALDELARLNGLPYAGSDGKTGETLVKSVLAPMFRMRALKVRSWSGTNLLGGGDGATLADPAAAAGKIESKGHAIREILGHSVEGHTHIDHVPDLGEWKTAWDHISFEGFLGTRMTLQFTWQGCDSALAAPLVLDLARLMGLALRRGEAGPQSQLGFFFKDPVTATEHGLTAQYERLRDWATDGPVHR